jgi:hypothetical protein
LLARNLSARKTSQLIGRFGFTNTGRSPRRMQINVAAIHGEVGTSGADAFGKLNHERRPSRSILQAEKAQVFLFRDRIIGSKRSSMSNGTTFRILAVNCSL